MATITSTPLSQVTMVFHMVIHTIIIGIQDITTLITDTAIGAPTLLIIMDFTKAIGPDIIQIIITEPILTI